MTLRNWIFLALLTLLLIANASRSEDVVLDVHADQPLHAVSRNLTGVCIEDVNHEIYGGLYSQMIFGESFQEPPPSPVIAGFSRYGGAWAVRDNAVAINGADGPKLVSTHAPFKDGSAGVELFLADKKGENAALLVRLDKAGIGADNFVGYEVALHANRQTVMLGRHVKNFERLKELPCDVPTGHWIALEVRLSGSVIEILVDGKSVLTHDDGAHALPAGTVGLRPWHREARYRNLWVKASEKREELPFVQTQDEMPVSHMWRPVRSGTAKGRCELTTEQPFTGTQSQLVSFDSGEGEWGLENQGLNHWGMHYTAGKAYEGYVWVRAAKPTDLIAALESRDGTRVYAQTPLQVTSPT